MARPQSRYVCQACAASTLRWEGQCRACGAWNSLVETVVREPGTRQRRAAAAIGGSVPVPIGELEDDRLARRATGIGELDRVLGGGLVAGSVVLVGGEPGIGKSTLVLEAASGVVATAGGDTSVLYVSGEESAGQLRLRASRLGIADGPVSRSVLVLAETDVERIVEAAIAARPALLVVDSVQTIRLDALEGPAGSVGQVRESTARIVDWAKSSGTPVVLVGHVTKDGSLAGPKTLEHIVDAVLALEGERGGGLRLLRATKNRFGSTEEIGVFEMVGSGLREVPDPHTHFLGRRSSAGAGVAVAASLEGSRPLLVEVQSLVAPAAYASPRRIVGGLDPNRIALLVAVLGRRAGLGFGTSDLYVSLAGGLTVSEPAMDLPVALALASSWRDRPVAEGLVACGEIGLLGELRPVTGLARRLREASRLGFREALVPVGGEAAPTRLDGLRVVAVETVREALERALLPPMPRAEPSSHDAPPSEAGQAPAPVPLR